MALGNIPLLAQTTVYSISLLLSITAFVPMAWHVRDFNGEFGLMFVNQAYIESDTISHNSGLYLHNNSC